MKIYTRRGDRGQTDLFGGARVSKANPRVLAYGALDAANSAIGFAASHESVPKEILSALHVIMSDVFDLGAELATAATPNAQKKLSTMLDSAVGAERILELERLIDKAESELTPLKTFVLPTGGELSCRFHLARTAVRRAEQEVVALIDEEIEVRDEVISYLNRLSDLMFVWARLSNHLEGVSDILWLSKKNR